MNQKIEQELHKVISQGNPYLSKAIQFFIGHQPMYLYAGEFMSREQLDIEYSKTAKHDLLAGYKERRVGYYDKWYRYSRADEGRAYDAGVRLAVSEESTPSEMHIIECVH